MQGLIHGLNQPWVDDMDKQLQPHTTGMVLVITHSCIECGLDKTQGWFPACAQPMRDVVTK